MRNDMPAALTSGNLCSDCNGTGADRAKTLAARRRGDCDGRAYIRCWACNGNGLDPAAYFRWSRNAAAGDAVRAAPACASDTMSVPNGLMIPRPAACPKRRMPKLT